MLSWTRLVKAAVPADPEAAQQAKVEALALKVAAARPGAMVQVPQGLSSAQLQQALARAEQLRTTSPKSTG